MIILALLNFHFMLIFKIRNMIFWNIFIQVLNIYLYIISDSETLLVLMLISVILLNVILIVANDIRYTNNDHEFEVVIGAISMIIVLVTNMTLLVNKRIDNICELSNNKTLCTEMLISGSRKLTNINKICDSDKCKKEVESYLNIK